MFMRLYIPVYALTLLLSASLLFVVQPLFAKMILPFLGGGPSIWNVSMVFFQAMLLAGYAYAHGIAKFLNIRLQTTIHLSLLLIFALLLPVAIPEHWEPPSDKDFPALSQLIMMAIAIGGPFFVLSASAPLLQHWFTHTDHPRADNPYFLYAVSNVGSMTALIAYPVVIEPLLTLSSQSILWSKGYVALIVLTLAAAILVLRHYKKTSIEDKLAKGPDTHPVDWTTRFRWLWLAFIPSSLLLGTTTYITTDIASAPLLWIVPLILYLGTFIISFSNIPADRYMKPVLIIHAVLLIAVTSEFMRGSFYNTLHSALLMHFSLFFVSALICHAELVRIKPHARHLTEFYLIVSLAGVLGGIFNSLLAPLIFNTAIEYPLMLGLAALARFQSDPRQSWKNFLQNALSVFKSNVRKTHWSVWLLLLTLALAITSYFIRGIEYELLYKLCVILIMFSLIIMNDRRWAFAASVTCLLLLHSSQMNNKSLELLHTERNYFGVVKVYDDTEKNIRIVMDNTTNHGVQSLSKGHKHRPQAYYHPTTPIGNVFDIMDKKSMPQKIAAIGLGIGSISCYKHPERHYDFYEINPAVVRIAENKQLFTILSNCGDSNYSIITGDGRIQLAKADDAEYDMLFLDAFSSDAIPVHLLTYNAVKMYLDKLKSDGFILVHITNRHLSLGPILYSVAKELGISVVYKSVLETYEEEKDISERVRYGTSFVILSGNENIINTLKTKYGWMNYPLTYHPKVWTDDYANILAALRRPDTYMLGLSQD